MRPIIDNLEQILDSDESKRYEDEDELTDKVAEVFERGIIRTEALNFIRGRSIAKTYLIIDEAQNMTPNQVKGIITWNENHSVGRSAADRQTISGRKNKWIKLCGKTYDE